MITPKESFELLLNTLSHLDDNKLNLNDRDLSYQIFEELASDYYSFLQEWTINRVIDNGLLNSALRVRILRLREDIHGLIDEKNSIKQYREDKGWIKIRKDAKSILKQITTDTNK